MAFLPLNALPHATSACKRLGSAVENLTKDTTALKRSILGETMFEKGSGGSFSLSQQIRIYFVLCSVPNTGIYSGDIAARYMAFVR